ncbi:MAG: CorA family divalent cation transporter [Gemmatimonadales bacterium]
MSEKVVFREAGRPFAWIDITGPSHEELHQVAERYGLHAMSVEDCLDPWHPPKFERFDDTTFVIVRAIDPEAGPRAVSVQELTRKIALFVQPELVLSIHRVAMPVLAEVEQRARALCADEQPALAVLAGVINTTLDSYAPLLDRAEAALDEFEDALFSARRQPPPLVELYLLKRRVTIMSRLIRQTNTVIQRLAPQSERAAPVVHDLRENAESYYFYADHLLESINNLLGIHVALASQRTNEVMRVLTVFSAFFLPLTFIVGVYGMNFRHMPELESIWAYPAVMLLMAAISGLIAWWFRRRGWLGAGVESLPERPRGPDAEDR